jgi:hypothetical protein
MGLGDIAGLLGAALILAAYAGVQAKRLDPHRAAALTLNFLGAALIVASLAVRFNLAAFLLESAWALIALVGLVRLGLQRLRGGGAGRRRPASGGRGRRPLATHP